MLLNSFLTNVKHLETTKIFFQIWLAGVLKETVNGCKVGQSVRELCKKADEMLVEETGKAFKKDKKVQKGK